MKKIVHITLATLLLLSVGCKQTEFPSTPTNGVGLEVRVELPPLAVESPSETKSKVDEQVETRRFGKSGVITISRTATEGIFSENTTKASWHEGFTNVWVFQFATDGTKLQGQNVGSVAANEPLATTLSVGTGTILYIIANGPATGLESIADETALLATVKEISGESNATSFWGKQTELNVTTLADGKGVVTCPNGRLRTLLLRPNAAQVNLNLDITSLRGCTVTSAELWNVPNKSFCISGSTMPSGVGYTNSWGGRTVAPYRWDIPENLQGTVNDITSDNDRNHAKSPADATYARITLKSDTKQVTLDVFPGGGLTDFNLKSNYIYNVNVMIVGSPADLELIASTDDRIAVTNSLREPANCYISYPKSGVYESIVFNALKKPIAKYTRGNSVIADAQGSNPASATDAALSEDIVYQAGDELAVVWQTAVNHQASGPMVIKSIRLAANGLGFVEINGPGNAVVAYKRGSTILWVYHLWATDSNPFLNHYATGSNVNGTFDGNATQFMDRNLGALSATSARPNAENAYKYLGLFYQHGRPTPFAGQGPGIETGKNTRIYDKSGNALNSSDTDDAYFIKKNNAVSAVKEALQTPNTHYYLEVPGYSWYKFADVSLWNGYGENKSIYDPCPYGYRVPALGSWTGFAVTPAGQTAAINAGSTWRGTWWPVTGSRRDITGFITEVGLFGNYWTATATPGRPYYSHGLYFTPDAKTLSPSDASGRAWSYAIRCVQEGY